jgi:dihydrodipicolinate synthase/N-acetylneuraminate lyase
LQKELHKESRRSSGETVSSKLGKEVAAVRDTLFLRDLPMPVPSGIFADTVTPRRLGMQDVNLGVMWELIDYLGAHKIPGLVLLGEAGEFLHFSNSERMRTVGLAPKRSRVPVIMNVTHSNVDGAVELAQASIASGVAGLLLAPPYHFSYSEADLLAFYRRFAEEAESPVPVIAAGVADGLGQRLVEDGWVERIADSSGTSISALACAVPEVAAAMARSFAPALAQRLDELAGRVAALPFPIGVRELVSVRGFKLGPHAVPLTPERQRCADELREWFGGWLPVVQQECKHA